MRNPVSTQERQAKTSKKVVASSKVKNPPSKQTRTVAKSTHPKYDVMIANAIIQNKQRSGSSLVAITKYIVENYKIPEDKLKSHLRSALKRAVTEGKLRKNKASYKIANRAALLPAPKKPGRKSATSKPSPPPKTTPTKVTKPKNSPKKVSPTSTTSVKPKTTSTRTSPAKRMPGRPKAAQSTGPKKTIEKRTPPKNQKAGRGRPRSKPAVATKTATAGKRGRKPKNPPASSPKKTNS